MYVKIVCFIYFFVGKKANTPKVLVLQLLSGATELEMIESRDQNWPCSLGVKDGKFSLPCQ